MTVFCLAYNHEKYIRTTFEGFVKQKTTFKFKVLVHDDASTDSTPDIIREYMEKYPDMFEAIMQEENKYQQGIDIEDKYILPKIDTKYVASCECDDYWTDPNKLQMQVEYMEKHPDCSLCVHDTEKRHIYRKKLQSLTQGTELPLQGYRPFRAVVIFPFQLAYVEKRYFQGEKSCL